MFIVISLPDELITKLMQRTQKPTPAPAALCLCPVPPHEFSHPGAPDKTVTHSGRVTSGAPGPDQQTPITGSRLTFDGPGPTQPRHK